MKYTKDQIDQVDQWLSDPDRDWGNSSIIDEFIILREIVVNKVDPIDWFNSLMEWALEAKAELEG